MTHYAIRLVFRRGMAKVTFHIASAYSRANAELWVAEQRYPASYAVEIRQLPAFVPFDVDAAWDASFDSVLDRDIELGLG